MRGFTATFALLILATVSHAAAPQLINYQGRLTDSTGDAVADNSYSVVFTIYSTAVGASSVWTETQNVTTTDGLFAVLLGSVNPILDVVFVGTIRYLGIAVSGDAELTPRTRIVTAPYSFRTATVDGATGGNISSKVSIGPGHTNPGTLAFVAGENSTASGNYSTVSGGHDNTASGLESTISGGHSNTANAHDATVGGGFGNRASGFTATVPGGRENVAGADYSFAAGRSAKANHIGSFVWADNSGGDFASSALNQFNVRASGGTRIYSNNALTTGVTLAAGGGAWGMVSDRNVKENIRPVDGSELLEKLSQLDISRWNYVTQDESIEHIGPMAQDFYELFRVGDNNTTITTIDPDGISLAAIKALYEKNQSLEERNDELNNRLDKLERLIEALSKK